MTTGTGLRGSWSLAGVAAGVAGLGASYFAAEALKVRESPVVAIADVVVRHTPGPLAEKAISVLGHADKPVLLVVIVVVTAVVFAWAGRLANRSSWAPVAVFVVLAGIGAAAVAVQRGVIATDFLPVVVGFVTWLVALSLLTEPLRRAELARSVADGRPGDRESDAPGARASAPPAAGSRRAAAYAVAAGTRRTFLLRTALVGAGAVVLAVGGRVVGRSRRQVEQARRLLRIQDVTAPVTPAGSRIGVDGVSPWMTSAADFYRIDTTIVTPTIAPQDWSLRIHGMVDRELTLTFDELVARGLVEAWVTIGCVSNEVGGDLIGNAWWSGVPIAPLLEEVGVQADADAIKQTSSDGWTCGTPLEVLSDGRDAMLAVAMNGEPLPIEHGFPVRVIVPGLYGYVSATKWVVDWEVTRFADFTAFWTDNGWSERGPVKMSSRIDVPRSGDEVSPGSARFAGMAWSQHTGIRTVEVAIDGGPWTAARLAGAPTTDTWVEWTAEVDVESGDHVVRVRATDETGLVQTSAIADTVPDGATGLHTVEFSAG